MTPALLVVLVLAGVWVMVSGDVHVAQWLLGLLFGVLFVLASRLWRRRLPLAEIPGRAADIGLYLLVVMPLDLVWSNGLLGRRLFRWRPSLRPGIVRVPLEGSSDAALGLEQHAATLSPGQMLVEHAPEEGAAYLHVVDIEEAATRRAWLGRLARGPVGRALS